MRKIPSGAQPSKPSSIEPSQSLSTASQVSGAGEPGMASQTDVVPVAEQTLVPDLWHAPTPLVQGVPTSKFSSVAPSQSSSRPSQVSAAGPTLPVQVSTPAVHASVPGLHSPVSMPQLAPPPGSPSSMIVSQSLSSPSQRSRAPGKRVGSRSSQSSSAAAPSLSASAGAGTEVGGEIRGEVGEVSAGGFGSAVTEVPFEPLVYRYSLTIELPPDPELGTAAPDPGLGLPGVVLLFGLPLLVEPEGAALPVRRPLESGLYRERSTGNDTSRRVEIPPSRLPPGSRARTNITSSCCLLVAG